MGCLHAEAIIVLEWVMLPRKDNEGFLATSQWPGSWGLLRSLLILERESFARLRSSFVTLRGIGALVATVRQNSPRASIDLIAGLIYQYLPYK